MLHASHSFLRHVPFWIRLGNRFDCIYITIITQATADSVWHVATLCFGCHRNMWPKRVNQIKPAAHQLTILSLRRPCIGCHSCRHCAFFSARQQARDEGMHTSTASHHRDTVVGWVNQMLSWSWDMTGQPHAGNCWHRQYFRLISILFPLVLILDLHGVLYPNRSTIHNVA